MQLEKQITQLADQCVKCGMCLPSCPTYQLSQNENESPRGRIALMQGVVQGELALSPKLVRHLDHCLGCLSCEKICPSTVQYETLIDSIRAYTMAQKPQSQIQARLISLLIKPSIQKSCYHLLRFYQFSGLQKVLRYSRILKLVRLEKQEKLLPKLYPVLKLKPRYPAKQPSIGSVALFTGCMGQLFEQKAIQASIRVLTHLGYNVDIPDQVCCGALHQHSGFPQQAGSLAKKNRQSFLSNTHYNAILFTASGCGAQLKSTFKGSKAQTAITSIMQFILQHADTRPLRLDPLVANIAIHQPCSLKNTLKESDAVIEVLNKIPGLKITELQSQCCGAAGKNMLTQTELANQIRQPLLEQINQATPDSVISSNVGCILHLAAGLQGKISVIHPIELVAKSLK
ncbi:(Fe-S)-binding protein [Beggiatoa alba]|nr:(Fe-S)-binding protein [Beggiatoa alba]